MQSLNPFDRQQRSTQKLSISQITQAKSTWTKEVKRRARDSVLASRVAAVLTAELQELNDNPFSTLTIGPKGDSIMCWTAYIMGPANTPYFGGLFNLRLDFPTTYPRDPPRVKFMTSMYHPGVDTKDGSADPSSFGLKLDAGRGIESNTIRSILEAVVLFFTPSVYSELEGTSVRNMKAKEQLKNDPRGFHETAVRFTYQYAR